MLSTEAIQVLESSIQDARRGLPEEVFLFISRHTPMVNVDLLVKDEHQGTLLTWRHDQCFGPGWHLPGGIVRFKEPTANRVKAVGELELGAEVTFEPQPAAINEIIVEEQKERAHFIALLFRCSLRTPPAESLRYRSGTPKRGEWAWHSKCPQNIIPIHKIYESFL